MTTKTLDAKLARIVSDPGCGDFILADAKDADMAYGLAAGGLQTDPQTGAMRGRSLVEYRELMRGIVEQGLVDIVLMSASTADLLARQERRFAGTAVTPAIRANDSTDIWLAGQHACYTSQPSQPFRTPSISAAVAGDRAIDLGLYSITLNGLVDHDVATLEAYRRFREEAASIGFRHFLEVFAPNAASASIKNVARFVNDSIARLLAGVVAAERPLFLKMPYFGPGPAAELANYDPTLVIGVLGGSAGTTHDAFQMVAEAKQHGVRAALFGRKINQAEDQLAFIRGLRGVADGESSPRDAVKRYHSDLAEQAIRPHRSLEDDLQLTAAARSGQ